MTVRVGAVAAVVLCAALSACGGSDVDDATTNTGATVEPGSAGAADGGGVGTEGSGTGSAREGTSITSSEACDAWRETVVATAQDGGIAVILTPTSNKGSASVSNSQGVEQWNCSVQLTHPDGQRVTSLSLTVSVDPRVIEEGCKGEPGDLLDKFPEVAGRLPEAEEATGRTWQHCPAGPSSQANLISLEEPGMWVASTLGTPTEAVGERLDAMKREFLLAWLAETGLSGLPEVQSSAGTAEDAMRALLGAVVDGDGAAGELADDAVVELLTDANADYGPLRLGTCQDESSPPTCTVFPAEPPGNINVEFERDGSLWRAAAASWVME